MAIHVSLSDPEGLSVICRASGNYNPDILDDLTTRASLLYKEALAFRQEILTDSGEAEEQVITHESEE